MFKRESNFYLIPTGAPSTKTMGRISIVTFCFTLLLPTVEYQLHPFASPCQRFRGKKKDLWRNNNDAVNWQTWMEGNGRISNNEDKTDHRAICLVFCNYSLTSMWKVKEVSCNSSSSFFIMSFITMN